MGSVPPTIPASTGAPPRRTADPHCARSRLAVAAAGLMMAACPGAGLAWGDEGHEIIARIADHYLEPPVRAKVAALLAADTTSLTRDTGMAAEAAWADKFRDSDRNADQVRYRRTRAWHYIDIELDRPQDGVACSRARRCRAELRRPWALLRLASWTRSCNFGGNCTAPPRRRRNGGSRCSSCFISSAIFTSRCMRRTTTITAATT